MNILKKGNKKEGSKEHEKNNRKGRPLIKKNLTKKNSKLKFKKKKRPQIKFGIRNRKLNGRRKIKKQKRLKVSRFKYMPRMLSLNDPVDGDTNYDDVSPIASQRVPGATATQQDQDVPEAVTAPAPTPPSAAPPLAPAPPTPPTAAPSALSPAANARLSQIIEQTTPHSTPGAGPSRLGPIRATPDTPLLARRQLEQHQNAKQDLFNFSSSDCCIDSDNLGGHPPLLLISNNTGR